MSAKGAGRTLSSAYALGSTCSALHPHPPFHSHPPMHTCAHSASRQYQFTELTPIVKYIQGVVCEGSLESMLHGSAHSGAAAVECMWAWTPPRNWD